MLTDAFDTLGAMAKSVEDLAALTEISFASIPRNHFLQSDLSHDLRKDFRGLKVGFVDVDKWQLPQRMQINNEQYLEKTVTI